MNHNHHQKGMGSKHVLLMLICCLIPIVAIGAIRLFDLPLNGVLYVGVLLLCPLSHLLMMGTMMKHEQRVVHEDHVVEGEVISRSSEPAE